MECLGTLTITLSSPRHAFGPMNLHTLVPRAHLTRTPCPKESPVHGPWRRSRRPRLRRAEPAPAALEGMTGPSWHPPQSHLLRFGTTGALGKRTLVVAVAAVTWLSEAGSSLGTAQAVAVTWWVVENQDVFLYRIDTCFSAPAPDTIRAIPDFGLQPVCSSIFNIQPQVLAAFLFLCVVLMVWFSNGSP